MRKFTFRTVMLFALSATLTVFLTAVSLMAQATTGSIRGVVTDANGAVVSGATVKIKNESTGTETTFTTNNSGFFQSASLPPGAYTVTIEANNFKKHVQTGVAVNIAVVSAVDAKLEPGSVSEQVTVVSNQEEVLSTEQSQISGSIDSRRIEELPSNGAGNGLDTLALLIPGVVTNRVGGTNTNGTGLSVNGNRGRSNNFQIDGADNNDLSVGGPALFIGFADAVQEFQVTTSNFDASYGRNQGAIVNYVTKGGTNDFHGSLFWHRQDDARWSSLTNVQRRAGVLTEPEPFIWDVYGGTVGGPIFFPAFGEGGPRIWNGRDKAFFFFGYQATRNPSETIDGSGNNIAILPSEFGRLQSTFPSNGAINAIVQANPWNIGATDRFSAPRLLTGTNSPVISSQINLTPGAGCPRVIAVGATPPAGCTGYSTPINPATGQPFLTGGPYDVLNFGTAANPVFFQAAQYERTGKEDYTEDNYVFRLDFIPTSKDNVMFRFFDQVGVSVNGTGSIARGITGNVPAGSRNYGGSWSHTFSNSLLNDFRASYQKIAVVFGGGCETGAIDCIPHSSDQGLAFTNITFPIALGVSTNNTMPTLGPATNLPQGRTGEVYQVADTMNWVNGKHSLRFGAEFKYLPTQVPFLPNHNGSFAFGTTGVDTTTQPLATRIINNAPSGVSIVLGEPLLTFKEKDLYFFFQDDWKPLPNLTLNLGVRWEYTGQPINQLHELTLARESNASTAFFNPSLPIEQRIVPKIAPDKNNFAPRLGFAWSPNPNGGFLRTLFGESDTVIRGGYSWAYEPAFYNILVNIMSNTPVAVSLAVQNNQLPVTNPLMPLPNDPIGTTVRAAAISNGVLALGVLDPKYLGWVDVASDFHAPHSQQWSFGIQRQFGRNQIAEVRYVGNKGVDLFQNLNGNYLIAPLVNGFTRSGITFPSFASLLPSGTTTQVCTDVAGTLDNEGACNGRQFPRAGLTTRANTGFSSYHGLQTRYNGRLFTDSLRLGATYTWSKTVDNASEIFAFADIASPNAQNPFCLDECEKSISNLHRPHAFTANFIYDIPFFKDQQGVLGRILGGWQLNGVYVLASGNYYTPNNNLGFGLGQTYLVGGDRAFLGNTSVSPTQVGISQIDAFLLRGIACNPAPCNTNTGFWSMNMLNRPAAQGGPITVAVTPNDVHYIINGPGAAKIFGTPFGDSPRNSEQGPMTNQLNFSIFKNIRLWERMRIQFRAEAFNVLNHPQPGFGNIVAGNAFSTINLTNAGTANGGFGTDTDLTLANRVIQFGLRLTF